MKNVSIARLAVLIVAATLLVVGAPQAEGARTVRQVNGPLTSAVAPTSLTSLSEFCVGVASCSESSGIYLPNGSTAILGVDLSSGTASFSSSGWADGNEHGVWTLLEGYTGLTLYWATPHLAGGVLTAWANFSTAQTYFLDLFVATGTGYGNHTTEISSGGYGGAAGNSSWWGHYYPAGTGAYLALQFMDMVGADSTSLDSPTGIVANATMMPNALLWGDAMMYETMTSAPFTLQGGAYCSNPPCSGFVYGVLVSANILPGAPTSLGGYATPSSVGLHWVAPSGTVLNYTLDEYGYTGVTGLLSPSCPDIFYTKFLGHVASTANSTVVTNLASSTKYCFEVHAWNATGEGTYSAALAIETDPSPVSYSSPCLTNYNWCNGDNVSAYVVPAGFVKDFRNFTLLDAHVTVYGLRNSTSGTPQWTNVSWAAALDVCGVFGCATPIYPAANFSALGDNQSYFFNATFTGSWCPTSDYVTLGASNYGFYEVMNDTCLSGNPPVGGVMPATTVSVSQMWLLVAGAVVISAFFVLLISYVDWEKDSRGKRTRK